MLNLVNYNQGCYVINNADLDKHYTANAKDFEVIKKVHGFWVIHLKN